jgi:hypothetical protein
LQRFVAALPVASALLVLACPTDAHAYLDPGTGSMMFQAGIALIVAALFTIKSYWQFLRAWFTTRKAAAAEEKPSDGK